MQRVNIGLVCLSWLFWASAVSAQTAVDPTSDAGIAAVQNYSGSGLLQGTYFDIRHQTGDGVGYRDSFSQIGGFTPFWLNEDSFIAPNSRLIITNSTQIGVNAGLVGRRYVEGLDRIFGLYGYYDNDQNSLNSRYSQFTVGAETLGSWWDLRGNGYFLNGVQDNFVSALGVGGNPYYTGNQISFLGTQLRDQAMSGGDVEFGVPVSANAQWLRAYSGVYGYRTTEQNTFGYRGRVEAMVSNDLTLGVMVSQDRLWGTNINATVDFKFSGFQPTRYFPNLSTRERMLSPVQRNWRIATHTYTQNVDVAAINPLTNQPYFITHVDNSTAAGGNGTIERPFNYLPNSAPGNIILVHRGNSSAANPVMGSIALSDNQRLLGDGTLSTVDLYARYGNGTVFGNYNLPETSNSGIYPFVSSAGNIVTLANYNEVAGLNLLNAGGSAITNTAAGSHNFLLRNLEIGGNAGSGISLANASGVGIIRDINVGTTNRLNPFGFGQNAGGGIKINSAGPGLDLAMTNVSMNANPAKPQPFGVKLIADGAYLNVNMNNVIANGNGSGIQLSETSQQLTATMNLVRANNNAATGIQVSGTGGSINLNMNNVAAMNNGGNNLQIGTQAMPILTSTVGIVATETNFSNSLGGSGIVISQSGGFGTIDLSNSIVTGNAVDGLGIFGSNNSLMNANVRDSQFQGNFRDAFHVEGLSASTVNLFVDPTNASQSGRDGLYFNMNGDSLLNVMFLNNNLNNSGRSMVHGELSQFAVANLFFDGTTGANSGGDGFYLNASGQSFANMEINHGTLANSGSLIGGSSAFNIVSDNSTVNLMSNMTKGNNINPLGTVANQAYGLTLDLKNASVFTGNIYNSDLSDTLVDAIKVNATTGSDATLTLINTSGNRSGFDGFVANVDYATLTTNFTNSGLGNSGRDGMNFHVSNGGLLNSTFNSSNLNLSGRQGIYGDVSGTNSVASINLLGGSVINGSGQNGVNFFVDAGLLNLTAYSSSISTSGLGGANGSGVLGVINNGGAARLDFANTAINNNRDNGVFVTTNTGSTIEASFNLGTVNNNGRTLITPRGNDGIRLNMNGSPFSSLQVYNGATITGNGNDGISLLATNGTNFDGTIGTDLFGVKGSRTATILNNGTAPPPFTGTRAGVDATSQSGANLNLILDGVTVGNSLPFGSQQSGLLFNANSGGQLNATVISSALNNNASDAINGSVTGPGSIANLSLLNVNGNSSGATGALFNVNAGGQLNVDGSVNTSFSQSGGSGLLVQVDGAGSVANFDLTSVKLDGNGTFFGGQGFNGLATGGGTLNACLDISSLQSNANGGIQLATVNPNSTINFNVAGSTVNSNGSEGLSIRVFDQGTVNYRSQGSSYNGNGANGVLSGVNVAAIGNGGLDSAIARLLFSGDTIDGNTGHGILLNAENGATMTTVIENGVSASNNGGFGVLTQASGANTSFNLLMNGANNFATNGVGPISPFIFANMSQVVLDITGSFNNSTADGVKVDLQNIQNAVVAIEGPGTINSSALNGINVSLKDVANGSVMVRGITTINNSGLDAIRIAFDNVNNGSIAILGPTTISNSGADAINLSVINSNLVDGLVFGGSGLEVLTLTDNLATPLNGCLPVPVHFTLNETGLVSAQALTINGMIADTSRNTGVSILATNSTIQTMNIVNNTIVNSLGQAVGTGDGIHFDLTSTPVQTLTFTGNQVGGSELNGVNFDLNASPIGSLAIVNNNIGTIQGGGSVIGDTLPIILPGFNANTLPGNDDGSTGLTPLGFNANFFGTTYNNAYVNNNGNITFDDPLGSFTPFNLLSTATPIIAPFFADIDTRSGNPVTYGPGSVAGRTAFGVNWLDVRHYDSSGGGSNGLPTNTFQLVMIDRSDIAPGDFDFEFNYQQIQWESGEASGSDSAGLGGSSARAGYSNGVNAAYEIAGSAVNGAFLDSGPSSTSLVQNSLNSIHDGRYAFFVRGGVVGGSSPNGGDGIRLNAINGSTISEFNVNSNVIANSGQNGVELLLSNSDLINPVFANNTINNNTGDGIRLVNPITPAGTISTVFDNNTITNNAGTGVNLSLVNGQQNLLASFSSNTISNNAGGPGVNIRLADNRNTTGGFDSNKINNNGAQGVNFNMGLNGRITSNFTNNTITGNNNEGVNLALNTGGRYEGAQFYGNTVSNNRGMGVRLTAPDQSSYLLTLGDSTKTANTFNANVDAGVGINMTGTANGNLQVQNSTFSNTTNGADINFNGDGLAIRMNNTATLNNSTIGNFNAVNSAATNDTTFSNNAGNGLGILAQGNSTMQNLLVTNVNSTGNIGDGINIFRLGNPIFNNTTIQNSQIRTNTRGINLIAGNALWEDEYAINNNQIVQNRSDGILLDVRFDAQIVADIGSNLIDRNGGDGIHLIEQQNSSSDNRLVSGTWTLNDITNNGLNGIEITARSNINIGASTTQVDNVIANNGLNGILITGVNAASTTVIQGNVINTNGADGIRVRATSNVVTMDSNTIESNTGDGIDLSGVYGARLISSIDNSSIRFNQGDGIKINSTGQADTGAPFNVTIGANNPNGNNISDNIGHGITILNQGDGNASITVNNNLINRNGLQGVYVVNTASGTQTQDSTTNVNADGSVFDITQMRFAMDNNTVFDNGFRAIGANFSDTTGLYLRVGTNGASTAINDAGGFASNASTITSTSGASLTGRGGVLALVTNNTFGGNAGHDVAFQGFTSTVAPTTGADGNWTDGNESPPDPTNDIFDPSGYQTDPLARLDLQFVRNNGQDANVSRSGASYQSTDPIWKSRIGFDPAVASPPGPFTDASRIRNAQRQASNSAPFNQPGFSSPFGGSFFLYPGVGGSTFRVSSDSDFNNVLNPNTNNFLANDQFTTAIPLGFVFGERSFVWTTNLAP